MEIGQFFFAIILFVAFYAFNAERIKSDATEDASLVEVEESAVIPTTDPENNIDNFKQQKETSWGDVRPVVIYFAGERFVVEYDNERKIGLTSPAVGMVHCYLGEDLSIGEKEH